MAESLCRKCYELEPKLATKSFIIAIKTMCEQVCLSYIIYDVIITSLIIGA